MTKIKVTVTFEDNKPSRIDALLKEFEIASEIANETKRELTPIIQEVGLAKHAAIMEQLEPIMDGMKKLSILKDKAGCENKDVRLNVYYNHPDIDDRRFVIKYHFNSSQFDITYCVSGWDDRGYDFKNAKLDPNGVMYGADRGIVTHWNKLGIIDKLNAELESAIQNATNDMIRVKKAVENKFHNLITD